MDDLEPGDTEGGARSPRPFREALADLLRAALGRDGRSVSGRRVPDPEEIADLVESMLAQSQQTEGLAMARVGDLERRLVTRGEEIVALAEELRRAHHEIKLERRARERLIERIGLRLAAPLQNLMGLMEAARDSEPYVAGKPWLRAATRVGEELARGLEDWRNEADAAPEPPGLIAFRPSEVLARVVVRAKELAEARGLVVEAFDRCEEGFCVLGDPLLFERALDTLVQHGLERTRRGCVALEMGWAPLEGEIVAVEVDVEDTARPPGAEVERTIGPDALAGEGAARLARTAHGLAERLGGWLERRDRGDQSSWRLTVEFPLPEPGRKVG